MSRVEPERRISNFSLANKIDDIVERLEAIGARLEPEKTDQEKLLEIFDSVQYQKSHDHWWCVKHIDDGNIQHPKVTALEGFSVTYLGSYGGLASYKVTKK